MEDFDLTPELFEKADALFAADDVFGALMSYHTALSDTASADDEAYASARIARCHLKFNQPIVGQPFLDRAVLLTEENLLSARVLATVAGAQGRYAWYYDLADDAAAAFSEQARLARQAKDRRQEIDGLNMLAIVQMAQHDHAAADTTLALAHELAETYTVGEQLGPVFNNRGHALRALGQHDAAMAAFERSYEAYQAEGDVHMQLVARYEMGVSMLDLGRYDESKACIEDVFAQADAAGLRLLMEKVWQIESLPTDSAAS